MLHFKGRLAARICWKVTIWLFSLGLNFITLVFFAGMHQFMTASVTQQNDELENKHKTKNGENNPCWQNKTGNEFYLVFHHLRTVSKVSLEWKANVDLEGI